MSITLRRARLDDREALYEVERKTTPGLIYLPHVFDSFVADDEGELIVAEADGQAVACGKFTRLPDGTAWLETLRVIPECQGQGIGKLFYTRFFELAHARNIPVMRMYTNIGNRASKGLAERFGFTPAGVFRGQKLRCQPGILQPARGGFQAVTDPRRAADLLMGLSGKWAGFLVMNRTFYAITPALAAYLAAQGMLYWDEASRSLAALGARFMPQQALHIGMLDGDLGACLAFALQRGLELGVETINCLYPPEALDVQEELARQGFQFKSYDFIVMEARLD